MRLKILQLAVLALLTTGCSDDPAAPVTATAPITYEMEAVTNWFITSPDVDLSKFSSVRMLVTFTNNFANDMNFNGDSKFQLWSDPDGYSFVSAGDVTINGEPSGAISPGQTFSFDLTVDLANVPADQGHIALRPRDTSHGTVGPPGVSLFLSNVEFTE